MIFRDRGEAGRLLAGKLSEVLTEPSNLVVLGIPRGGVVVAAEVSKLLKAPLEVVVVRKLGVPGHEEFAFGAIDVDGQMVIDQPLVTQLGLSPEMVEAVRKRELAEALRREALFREGRPRFKLNGKTAVIVDDGLATGATAEAAINYVRGKGPARLILATPVAAGDTVSRLKGLVDGLVVLDVPDDFMAVGQFYHEFPQVSDEEVGRILSSGC